MQYDIINLQEKIKNELSKKRYIHSLGVQYTAACLAMKFDVDITKAQVAGVLHDCAKCFSNQELLAKCMEHHIPITETENRSAYLLHAKLGAYFAEHIYGICDQEILSAIMYHTTGRPDMSILEKIIFVADYIEPSRKEIFELGRIRKIAFENLDLAILTILSNTLSYLKEDKEVNRKEIDQMTEKAFDYYRKMEK